QPNMSDDHAEAQANEHQSFARSATITTDDGQKFTVRNPLYLSASQLVAYNELHHRINKCDRWPDVDQPEQKMKTVQPDGTEVETYIGARTIRGDYIEPYQENGVMVNPPYEIQAAMIVMGDKYDAFEAAGGSPREVVELLAELRRGVQKRVDADPKSDGRGGVLAAVPAPDSQ
ncbi:hypothetical protein R4531_22815, partial [Mycolicibacterium fortuitum]